MGAFFRAESTLLPQYILKCIITAMMQQQSATNNTKQHEKRTTQKDQRWNLAVLGEATQGNPEIISVSV